MGISFHSFKAFLLALFRNRPYATERDSSLLTIGTVGVLFYVY